MAGNLKTGWVKIATSGKTVDGRKIEKEWLTSMAENYDPEYYGALIWPDHYRYRNMGKVVALKTGDATEKGLEGEIHLFAILAPNDDLIYLNKIGQYIYTSIEVEKNFAGSGKTYLGGLAVTDTPASLGTTGLQFSADNNKVLFRGCNVEFEIENQEKPGFFSGFFNPKKPIDEKVTPMSPEQFAALMEAQNKTIAALNGLTEQFKSGGGKAEPDPKDKPAPKGDEGGSEKFATQDQFKDLGDKLTKITESVEKISNEFAELRKSPVGGTKTGGDEGGATKELL